MKDTKIWYLLLPALIERFAETFISIIFSRYFNSLMTMKERTDRQRFEERKTRGPWYC